MIRRFVLLVALLLLPSLASAQPGVPQVGSPTLGSTTVSFPVTWTASTAPYTLTWGFNDSSLPGCCSGSAGSNSTTIVIPYHFDGLAASAFTCVADANNLSTCNNFTVPAVPPDSIPPSTPMNLATTASGSDRLSHTWTASTDNNAVLNYRVERAPFSGTCGTFTEIAHPMTTAYLDTGLTVSTTYCTRVRAFDGRNFSVAYSNTTIVTTLAYRVINLAWDDNSPNAQNPTEETGFQIERCMGTACSNFQILSTVGTNVTTFSDTASPNPVAGYRVTAVPTGGGYSNIVYSPVSPPILATAPPSLTFSTTVGSNPPTQAVMIINNNGATPMPWNITDNASWLSVTPTTGTDNGSATVSVNVAGLVAATYFATITVSAPGATGSPSAIPVTLVLSPVSLPGVGSSGRIR